MFSKSEKTADFGVKVEKRRRFWRKARRGAFWTLVGAFVLHSSLNLYASVQLNRELAALREKGEPLQLSELKPPAVPDSQNAALVYDRAFKALHLTDQEDKSIGVHRDGVKPEEAKWIESAVRKNQEPLALVRQAATMPGCNFPLDWSSDPTQLKVTYYGNLRVLARLLASDAKIQVEKGHRDVALQDARAIFGMSHHLAHEPFLIGFLVAQAIESLGYTTVGQILSSEQVTVPEARTMLASWPAEDWTASLQRSLSGERTMEIYGFSNVTKISSENSEDPSVIPLIYGPLLFLWRPILKLDEVQTLQLWRAILEAPGAQQIPRPVGEDKIFSDSIKNLPRYAMLTRLLFPVFSKIGDKRDSAEVRRREMEVAAALACYRTANGHYPTTLQPAGALWGKPLPLDPYSGKAFLYRLERGGYVLYSVGVNRLDDDGQDRYHPGTRKRTDVDDIPWVNFVDGVVE